VTFLYALLSVYLRTHQDAVRAVFGRLPMIGTSLAEKRLDPSTVQLANVRGSYQRVKGDHLVFVIAGTAINNAPVPVRAIQIEGRVIGAEEQHQVVFCGAAPRDVQDLSVREIALLQTLEPRRTGASRPGSRRASSSSSSARRPSSVSLSPRWSRCRVKPDGTPSRSDAAARGALRLALRLGVGFGLLGRDVDLGRLAEALLESLDALPEASITSGSRPAPNITSTMTSMMTSSPIPIPNMARRS